MNLAQMYALANSKSGYARSDAEIYAALDAAGFRVYTEVLNTFRGSFIKFDETSITLLPNTQEYTLPTDLTQIVHLAERVTATDDWHTMDPETLDDALTNIQNSSGWNAFYSWGYGSKSPFCFYGPYLDATQTLGAQTQKIRVSPAIDQTRFCQLAYTAKWLPIVDASSKVMLPDEGTHAMLNWATATLCGDSDDTKAERYEAAGDKDLTIFLKWMRARQVQDVLTIDTYGPGL